MVGLPTPERALTASMVTNGSPPSSSRAPAAPITARRASSLRGRPRRDAAGSDGRAGVAQALDSPLMLSLLLETYLPSDPVGELTDPRRFPGRQQIEDHLIARILPAAYTSRPGDPAPPCTSQQARQWLGYLAAQMNRTGTRDLAWWPSRNGCHPST